MEEQNNQIPEDQEVETTELENKNESTSTTPKKNKREPKVAIIIGALAVVAIAIAVVRIVLLGGNNSSSNDNTAPLHIHTFGEWEIVQEATCTTSGKKEHFCACGEKQTQNIAAVGHKYSSWNIITEATCTSSGMKKQTCSTCGNEQSQTISAKGHSYGKWIVDKESNCLSTGTRHAICSKCNHEKSETTPVTQNHNYNAGTITTQATCTTSGIKLFTCTICQKTKTESISPLGHSTDSNSKCTRCGLVTLNMTSSEIANSKKIKTMSHSVSEYSDEIIINITLKDGDSYSVQVPVYVDVKIVDDNGNILYSKTIIKKSSQSKVTIDYDEITDAFTNTGTLYYTVYNDYVSFDAISKELEKIPWTVTIELPNVPQTISYTGYYASSCKVTGITYEVSDDDVTFYFTGEKTYDKNGNSYSQSCKIGWKLYDEDGYVVEDGTCYTTSIKVGEKFKDASDTAYNVIEQGKTYRLVIMNVS